MRAPRLPKNFVFRKEAGPDRHAANRQPARAHRQPGDRHVLAQSAHAPHVLLVMHAVNYRAGAEEQLRLEERVRHHVKDRRDEGAHATGQKHVTELRNGRVGKHLLDVVLREADRGREQSGRCADDRDDEHRGRCVSEDRRTTHDHVDAGRDHRGRVDQRRHRRRAGHRIRQPNEQRNLRALSGRADEEENGDGGDAAGKDRLPGESIDWHCGNCRERAGYALRGLSKKLIEAAPLR